MQNNTTEILKVINEVCIKLKLLCRLLRDSGEYYAAFRIDRRVEEIGKYLKLILKGKK